MDLLDTADPAWLDEFLAEDLKATGPPVTAEATFPYNTSAPSFSNAPRMAPNTDFGTVSRLDDSRYNVSAEQESLLQRFKFLKSMKKLSIPKIAEMLQIPKTALQRFSSRKDKNFAYLARVKDWIYHPSNREGLRCFENNQRSEKITMMSQSNEEQNMNQRRDSHRGPFRDSSFTYMYGDSSTPTSHAQPFYRNPTQHEYQSRHQPPMTPTSYNMGGRGTYSDQQGGAMQHTRSFQTMNGARSYNASGRRWNHMQSLEVLSQMLKRDTNKLLHKGIDSAIQEYLDQSKTLREKMKAEPHTRENDYFYKKQGKLLLNRLTTICGDDVVNRATSVLSDLKSKRDNRNGRIGTASDLQRLANLTKTWNHACSCRQTDCTFPNCKKIKPAVTHQLRLKDERKRKGNPDICCTIRNCEHCLLYTKLKSFSTSTRSSTSAQQYSHAPTSHRMASQLNNQQVPKEYASRSFSPRQPNNVGGNEQRLTEYNPSYHNSYTSSTSERQRYSQSQSYSSQRQGHRPGSGMPQMFNQQNNVTNNTQNVNHTNVSYNTYNIHTKPVMKAEGTADSASEDMASLVEVLGDERKHNVNINVNVSLYGNTQKRKQESQQFGEGLKKPRAASSGYQAQQGQQHMYQSKNKQDTHQQMNRNSSLFSLGPLDPEGTDVVEDLADLFPDTPSAKAHLSPVENETNNNGRRVLCVVCHGKERDALFKPCNHCCACMNCALKLRTCPMCRAPVDSTSHIFLS